MSLKPFEHIGGNDLAFAFNCTCSDPKWGSSSVAHLFKTKIYLSGYNDDYFFTEVNAAPKIISCPNCSKQYSVQWFTEGVEYKEVSK